MDFKICMKYLPFAVVGRFSIKQTDNGRFLISLDKSTVGDHGQCSKKQSISSSIKSCTCRSSDLIPLWEGAFVPS